MNMTFNNTQNNKIVSYLETGYTKGRLLSALRLKI